MSDTSVVNQIQHYQRGIEKCTDNQPRVLHCIEKLYRLPVTVQHLQETGVGRTVNALRKYEGTVGDAAKALVAKWKLMVVEEESSDYESENCVPDVPEGNSDNSDSPREKANDNQNSGSHESRHSRNSHNSSKDNSKSTENSKSRSSTKEDREKSSKSSEKESNHSKHKSRSEKKTKESKNDRHNSKKDDGTYSHNRGNKTDSKKDCSTSDLNDSHRKRKYEDESVERRHDKRLKTSISDDSGDGSDQFFPEISFESDNESKINIEVKSESPESPPSNYRESSSKDNTKKEKSGKEKSRDDKHKHSSHKHKSKRDKDHRKSDKSKKEDSKSSSRSSNNQEDVPRDSSSKSKEKKSSESKEKHKHREHKDKKSKTKINGHDGIDCNSGTSFADALGMCTTSTSRKKNCSSPVMSKSMKIEPSTSTNSSNSNNNSSSKPIKIKTELSPVKEEPRNLLAPNVKLEPLNVDLALTLPEISANYKPLPTNHMNSNHRRQEEDKALSNVMYAKNLRTKVYSGNKTSYTSVPSLYDLCIRVLIDNIEALEATGGVPFFIIKPVLERATAEQLFMIEHYNPYLIEDTDDLWKFHCNREFRTKQREEMESWREMYMRCLDEREAKLKALTANIKQSQDKSLPVRVAKLAYVDNVVKPPRNILKKQAKYGTANVASSSDLKKKLITGGTNSATNISVPPPPMGRVKTTAITKKARAPLMAKALQLIKGRYRR